MALDTHEDRGKLVSSVKEQLDKLNSALDSLEVKANLAKADAGDVIQELSSRLDRAMHRMKSIAQNAKEDLIDASGDDWERTKNDADELLKKAQEGITALRDKIKS